jgi:hypothetical protein
VDGQPVERVVLPTVVELVWPSPPAGDDGVVAEAIGEITLLVGGGDREPQGSGGDHPLDEAVECGAAIVVTPRCGSALAH